MKEFSGGLDVAEMDGSDREPFIRLKMTFSDSMTEKDRERCKEIFDRALSEIKEVIDKNNPCKIVNK